MSTFPIQQFSSYYYAVGRPDLKNNWDNAHAGQQVNSPEMTQWINSFPTFQDYLKSNFDNDPQGVQSQVKAYNQVNEQFQVNASGNLSPKTPAAPATTGGSGLGDLTTGGTAVRSDLQRNWDTAKGSPFGTSATVNYVKSFPSLEAYVAADAAGNPEYAQRSVATQVMNQVRATTTATPTTPTTPTTPVTTPPGTRPTGTGLGDLVTGGPGTTTGGTGTTPATSSGFNIGAYAAEPGHENLINVWTAASPKDKAQYGSFEQFVLADALANGTSEQKSQAQVRLDQIAAKSSTTPTTDEEANLASGGNYRQNQSGNQTGDFFTRGTNQQNQSQDSGTTSAQNTQGTVTNQGTNQQSNVNTQTGTINNTGTTTQNTTGTNTGLTNTDSLVTQNLANTQQGFNTQQGTTGTDQKTGQRTIGTQQATGGTTQQGTTAQTGTGQVATTGTTTTTPTDTLGFGALLQGAAPGTQATDTARTGFLQDLVQTGGANFNSQVEQAVRNSLTGPQMSGAGDSARARAAGYAGAQVARNNMGERLNAAGQLAGPTGLQQLVSAGTPYIGQSATTSGQQASSNALAGTTSNIGTSFNNLLSDQNVSGFLQGLQTNQSSGTNQASGTNTGTTGTTGSQSTTGTTNQDVTGTTKNTQTQDLTNTGTTTGTTGNTQTTNMGTTGSSTGWQDLVSRGGETSAGTASGTSAQKASGLIPEGKQVSSGGGCVVCTAGVHHGLWRNKRILRRVIRHKLITQRDRFHHAARGYFYLFTPFARYLLRHPTLTRWSLGIARDVVYEELRVSGRRLPFRVRPWLFHWTWHGLCSLVGYFPIPDGVTDSVILHIAQKHGILQTFGEK